MAPQVTLILGGGRSGKSAHADKIAAASGRPVVYVATATTGDPEMAGRIAQHRSSRPKHWRTVEEPLELARALRDSVPPGDLALVDCLTLWTSNRALVWLGERDAESVPSSAWVELTGTLVEEACEAVDESARRGVEMVVVSNEVGMGVIPPYPLGRAFVEVLGRVNQAVAARASRVILMVAGLPIDLLQLVAAT